jgi:multidrug efflux pump subunit AcrB
MEELAANLPAGIGYEWTGTTYQQKQAEGHEGIIFGFAAVLVFLFLAALYESWSVPFAVLFALPLGLFGALLAVYLRHYPYDIYTQIGIVTLIGLAAKNAILIVEFAKVAHEEEGKSVLESALEAARLRLRPILMTSFAFILGVLPLFLAMGASSASRRSLGTTVFGGMLAATILAVFIVPVLFVVIEGIVERRRGVLPSGEPIPEV